MTIYGRNLITGLPQATEVSSVEIREALTNPVNTIVATVKETIDDTPPELVADLIEQGIAMAGGASQLQGLAQRLSQETKMRVYVADDPVTCVVRGAGAVLENLDALQKVLVTAQRGRSGR